MPPIAPDRGPSACQEHRTQTAYHLALFPNTFFSLYPDAVYRIIISPQARGVRTRHECVERAVWYGVVVRGADRSVGPD